MIGRQVTWRWMNADGATPSRDISGLVLGLSLANGMWVCLVEQPDGTIEQCDAKDLKITDSLSQMNQGASNDDAEKVIACIRELGLEDDNTIVDPFGQACDLLKQAALDLQEAVEKQAMLEKQLTEKRKKKGDVQS